jgi:hypothetical protein
MAFLLTISLYELLPHSAFNTEVSVAPPHAVAMEFDLFGFQPRVIAPGLECASKAVGPAKISSHLSNIHRLT